MKISSVVCSWFVRGKDQGYQDKCANPTIKSFDIFLPHNLILSAFKMVNSSIFSMSGYFWGSTIIIHPIPKTPSLSLILILYTGYYSLDISASILVLFKRSLDSAVVNFVPFHSSVTCWHGYHCSELSFYVFTAEFFFKNCIKLMLWCKIEAILHSNSIFL